MDFSWTPEQVAARERVTRLAREELNEDLAQRDVTGTFSRALWRKCAEAGLLGSTVPVEYGGRGRDILTAVCLLEALGYGCRDNGLTLAVNSLVWTIQEPLLAFGSEEQKRKYLPRLCAGDILAADAVSEEEAGSDAISLTTTAERIGDEYILNGRKTLIGLAPLADVAVVYARTDPAAGQWGLSAFLIERGTRGMDATPSRSKCGLRTLPTGGVEFVNCVVPAASRLGAEGAGLSVLTYALEWERCFIFTSQVGAMARQLEEAVQHARTRRQFGRAVGRFQAVSHRVADMHVRLETSRLLLYKLAWLKGQSHHAALDSAVAKLHLSESFVASSLDAVRTHGGRGYMTDNGIERDLRDAVGGVIYAGTSDIQRNLIARLLGLP